MEHKLQRKNQVHSKLWNNLIEGGREGKGTDLVTLEMSEHSKTKAKGTSHKHRTLAGKVEGWGWGGNS